MGISETNFFGDREYHVQRLYDARSGALGALRSCLMGGNGSERVIEVDKIVDTITSNASPAELVGATTALEGIAAAAASNWPEHQVLIFR